MSTPQLLQLNGISKRYPGVVALDDVSVTLDAGEVLAICGENGAGKSTLMKILAGVVAPDSGTIILEGEVRQFQSPSDAMRQGIFLIHQELSLAENLTVLENLFLGNETVAGGPLGWLVHRPMNKEGARLLEQVGLAASLLHQRVSTLSPGQKQLIEIAKALGQQSKILIMDEPTSSLTQKETERLYEVIEFLKQSRVAVVYISHRLEEIRRCADRVVVLRDGRYSGTLAKHEIHHSALVNLMVGRDLSSYFPRTRSEAAKQAIVKLEALEYAGGRAAVNLEVRPGEVLGMAGLIGAGRTELAEAVFGLRTINRGTITILGKQVAIRKPTDAIAAGILLVPEDRRHHGLILEASIGENLSLPNFDQYSGLFGWVYRAREQQFHRRSIENLHVRTPTAAKPVGMLSGGNQQKVVFAKWLERRPCMLILDEPTRGVDVGAKAEIYALIDRLCSEGTAVWMITSDMEELLGISDRIVVMHDGKLSEIRNRADCSEQIVMTLAMGGAL